MRRNGKKCKNNVKKWEGMRRNGKKWEEMGRNGKKC